MNKAVITTNKAMTARKKTPKKKNGSSCPLELWSAVRKTIARCERGVRVKPRFRPVLSHFEGVFGSGLMIGVYSILYSAARVSDTVRIRDKIRGWVGLCPYVDPTRKYPGAWHFPARKQVPGMIQY